MEFVRDNDDSSDDDAPRQVDWAALESIMSADTLAALKTHMNGGENVQKAPTIANMNNGRAQAAFSMDNKKFKEKDYWESRFAEEDEYDWLVQYSDMREKLLHVLSPTDRILVVGCGNSKFSEQLYDDGFHNIINIDFSQVVIDRMSAIHSAIRSQMQWIHMDMTDLKFSEPFDVVIDKASMDALMVDENSVWDPNPSVVEIVDKMCLSVRSVLKLHGKFVQVSFAQPHFRSKYLMGYRAENNIPDGTTSVSLGYSARYRWELLPIQTIEKETGCLSTFFYIMECK